MAAVSGFVVGTAGHVDHGKTSLVLSLTGVRGDRLPEEQSRGMTIDLGFAPLSLPGGREGSIIDVPGHERLVHTMVRGAAGIDVALLVVAADDGVMPQTREHLAVCAFLGIPELVVALTKTDAVDADVASLARLEIEDLLATTTPYGGAAVVPCSSRSGAGLSTLRAELLAAVARAPRAPLGPAFLPIDRAFTKPGFGTIVTGTLSRGHLVVDDEVEVLTARGLAPCRVRGLQVHGVEIGRVEAKARVAVSLRGLDDPPVRGGALSARGALRLTRAVVAVVATAHDASPLPRRSKLIVHSGGEHVSAVVSLLDRQSLAGGERATAYLALERSLLVGADDRLVLRRPSLRGLVTVGGGRVLDPLPTLSRRRLGQDPPREEASLEDRARALVAAAGLAGLPLDEATLRLPPMADVSALLARVAVRVPGTSPVFIDEAALSAAGARLVARVERFHREHPALAGAPIAEVLSGFETERGAGDLALASLVRSGALVREDGLIAVETHLRTRRHEVDLARVASAFAAAGLTPKADGDVALELGLPPATLGDLLAELRRRRVVQRLAGMHFDAEALGALTGLVQTHLRAHGTLSAGELKALGGGLSRKFAIPLLEWLDSSGATRRRGDLRTLPGAR